MTRLCYCCLKVEVAAVAIVDTLLPRVRVDQLQRCVDRRVDQLQRQLLVVDVGGAVAADTPTQLPALRRYVLLHQLRLLWSIFSIVPCSRVIQG